MSINPKPYKELHPVNQDFPVRINRNSRQFTFPPHYHNELEMVYLTKGHMVVNVNHNTYHMSAGDLLIIGSHHIHAYGISTDKAISDYYLLIFDWNYLTDLGKNPATFDYLAPLLLDTHLLKKGQHLIPYASIFEDLLEEYHTDASGRSLMVTSLLYKLLTLSARSINNDYTRTTIDSKQLVKAHHMIHAINALIYKHYNRDISLGEAAEVAGYSLYHFTRVFKSQTGFTFKEYLTNFRINMVKEALTLDQQSITEIALSHGFNSIKSFNRNFKAITSMSPSAFRAQRTEANHSN